MKVDVVSPINWQDLSYPYINELNRSEISGLARLVKASLYKDDDTGLHVVRVAFIALEIGRLIGIPEKDYRPLFYAAAIHDVGKIGIPDSILKKQGPLTPDERVIIETHSRIGFELLGGYHSEILDACRDVSLNHHENFDGTGYPDRVSGEDIPLLARVVAIADVYDALTMDRCYRPAFTHEEAISMMIENMAGKFDPSIMDLFISRSKDIAVLKALIDKYGQFDDLYSFYG